MEIRRPAHRPNPMLPFVRILPCLLALAMTSSIAIGATIVVTPIKDNTLYEDVEGDLSNGAGQFLFAGLTGLGLRRALLAFDLSSIPPGSIINSVSLTMFLSRSSPNPSPENISLHIATNNWGEGGSNAGDPGGFGTAAQPGDATWVFNFFGSSSWNTPGGDFRVAASATTSVDLVNTTYTWSGGTLVSDVQAWLDNPETNFGWLVRGNEVSDRSAQRFNSSESATNFPRLTVTYTIPEPSSLALLAAGAIVGLNRRRSSPSKM
jgi:PEP-CTERM motif